MILQWLGYRARRYNPTIYLSLQLVERRIARISPAFFVFKSFRRIRKNHDDISSFDMLRFARFYSPARKPAETPKGQQLRRDDAHIATKAGVAGHPSHPVGVAPPPAPRSSVGVRLGGGHYDRRLASMNESIRRRCVFSVPGRRGQFAGGVGDSISPRGTSGGTAMERSQSRGVASNIGASAFPKGGRSRVNFVRERPMWFRASEAVGGEDYVFMQRGHSCGTPSFLCGFDCPPLFPEIWNKLEINGEGSATTFSRARRRENVYLFLIVLLLYTCIWRIGRKNLP